MIRLLIFIIWMLLLGSICNGQGRTSFGATRAQDTSFTRGQFKLEAYGGSLDTMLLIALPNGDVKKVAKTQFGGNYIFSTGLTQTGSTITNNLSTGVSGGQTIYGGTGSGENLTLFSTSHATKGKIILGSTSAFDGAGNRVGIGTTSPSFALEVSKNSPSATERIILFNNGTAGNAWLQTSAGGTHALIMGSEALSARNFINANDGRLDIYTAMLQPIVFLTGTSVERMRVAASGNVSIGVGATPTAFLHIRAGIATAGFAPLKFTAGTNLTTPEAGAVEFNGTNYFVTSSTTRYTLAKTLTNTATLDFGNTAAQTSAELTITVTGAADGDVVTLGVPSVAISANSCFTAYVSAANTVTVRFNNYSSGAIDPSSGTFRVSVIKY